MGMALVASVLVVPSGPAMGAAPDPAPGRLAFTDAQDSVRQVGLVTGDGMVDLAGWTTTVEGLGAHSGEVRGDSAASEETPTGGYAFVSTRPTSDDPAGEDPDGEVWYRALNSRNGGFRYVQVTDDASTESHPDVWVVEKNCDASPSPSPSPSDAGEVRIDVAFASNRSGNWDIWVAQLVRDPAAPANQCEALVVESVRQVTTDPGDDLWPAWSRPGRGSAASCSAALGRTPAATCTRSWSGPTIRCRRLQTR